jgi:adenine-specific DNA-methyltransferase
MPSLNFKGKALVQNFHLVVPYHELKLVKSKSLTPKPSLHDNLVVHGDNLKALKALLPYYHGKVKCIYIDPPYNTGNEKWVYNDNVSSPMMQEWLGKVVDREDLTRHDKWLCMMMPRLKLLREFLTDDGVIFVSIDDNEAHWLRGLMDEMFGEANFITTIVWEKADSPRMDVEFFSSRHDTVIAFARDLSSFRVNREQYDEDNLPEHYDKVDDEGRAYYLKPLRAMGGQGETREARPNLFFALIAPNGKKVYPRLEDGNDGAWRWSKEKTAEEKDRIEWREGPGGWTPYFRIYADTSKGTPPETIFRHADVGSSRTSRSQLKDIFPEGEEFDTPKPLGLLRKLFQIATNPDSIILDAFSGSGATGHAVLQMNKSDGGKRKFLLIESEDYAHTLTAERIRRAIRGVPKAKDEMLRSGLGGSFSYAEIGHAMQLETLLKADKLPTYADLASYVFYTATGEDFDVGRINRKAGFIGESAYYDVYLLYEPDIEYLKKAALTLDVARGLPKGSGKKRLVFAPTKYLDSIHLDQYRVEFCQLPFEIYKAVKRNA